MGNITKITSDDKRLYLDKQEFTAPHSVQGATMTECGSVRRVESAKRFKLYAENTVVIRIAEGGGFLKWKRGEITFQAEDVLRICGVGEFELNGKCVFLYYSE